jgi:predicted dehydrogenase
LLRIALVGAGAMGTIMARDIYPRLKDVVEVAVVVDRHPERGGPLAELLGARYLPSLDEAVAAGGIDGVDIRLQHSAHRIAATAAMTAGLHVLVEKPVVTTVEDGAALLEVQKRTGVSVGIAENYPHLGATIATRAAIDRGVLGRPLMIRSTRAFTLDGVWAQTNWRQGAGPEAGLLWDQGTHHTSMIRAIGGNVRSVAAAASALDVPGAEAITLTLELESGLVAQSLYCWGTPMVPLETEALILGESGRIEIRVDYDGTRGGADLVTPSGTFGLSPREGYYDSHATIVEDWVAAVAEGRAPRVDLSSAIADVHVVVAAQRSLSDGGRAIALREVA